MRVVVVGAGVVGLLTAVECVRGGAAVDLVDQSDIPHALATSHDSHRVVRTLHRGDAPLTLAAAHLHRDWLEIERRLGARFFHHTGVLTAMSRLEAETALAVMAQAGSRALLLSADELTARYPHVSPAADSWALFEPEAGTVRADLALAALSRWLRGHPAVREHPRRRAVAVDESGSVVFEDGSALHGDRVVVAAGPWSRALLPTALTAGLAVKRQTMLSYAPGGSAGTWSGSPAILGLGGTRDAWVMPPIAGAPVRLSAASACRTVPEMTDRVTPQQWLDHVVRRFSAILPGFDPRAVIGATDGYYLTDDAGRGPVLAELGGGAVLAYAACGGMSFKFGPAVARTVADLAMGRPPRRTGLDPIDHPRRFAAQRERSTR
jgi:glycine/D-amino acid oxidase-like deaminating enzyme